MGVHSAYALGVYIRVGIFQIGKPVGKTDFG
jgi:hypothetical protein